MIYSYITQYLTIKPSKSKEVSHFAGDSANIGAEICVKTPDTRLSALVRAYFPDKAPVFEAKRTDERHGTAMSDQDVDSVGINRVLTSSLHSEII